jgi:hypothetical protein
VVTVGETVTFDASDSNFCSDYAGIVHGFLNFPKNHAENISGYPKYFFDKRDNENKDCTVNSYIDVPASISYLTLSGYDPTASDVDNLPYVALRVSGGCYAYPDYNNYGTPIDTKHPAEFIFDYKVEAFGDQYDTNVCPVAVLFAMQTGGDTTLKTLYIGRRQNGKTVITTDPNVPYTGDLDPSYANTQELTIDWSQWHTVRITIDYTKAFITTNSETIQGHNCTYFKLYIDDEFIPFTFHGSESDFEYNGIIRDGSLYPDGNDQRPYWMYKGFAFSNHDNLENGAVLFKNFWINRYVGQASDVGADWYLYTSQPTWTYIDSGIKIDTEIQEGRFYNAETNYYRITVYNQWGSSNTIDYTEQCILPPTVSVNYVLQSTGIPVTVTGDTEIELSGTDIVTLNAITTSGMTHVNAKKFYPWENDATTHSGDSFSSLGDLNNSSYQSMIDYSDGWLQLNGYTGGGPDASFGSNYYDFETLEGFFRITTEDVNAMLQETGSDNKFYIPLIMFGVFSQYSNQRCYVCYNPKVNLDNDKSIATFGKKTEGTFSICRFKGSNFKQVYFTFPKLEDTDIYHIALCYRVSNKRMCFVFINGICVFSAKFDDKVLNYSGQKAVLGTNSSAVNWIPVTLAMRSIRESLVKVYDVNFDMKGCFTFEDYPNGYAVSDDYYAFVGNQLAQRKYFDPAVLYPDSKLTYQVINPNVNNSWWLTLLDEEEQKISENDTAVVAVNRNCIYTLKSQDSAGGQVVNLNLDFVLHVPPIAVITTDSLVVYKGAYVTLSGADSFDNITAYGWSNGGTSSEITLLIDHTQNISLTVTNAYGSDTTSVTIVCKDTPVIDKSPNLITVTTDALEVPISAIPYQEFYIILNNQNCYITLRQLGDYIYASLRVDNNVIFSNVICNINAPLNVYPSPYFTGILQFYDEKGTDKPHYSELGTRWKLKYRESRLPGEVY